jgi:hypothetical protein
MTRWKPNIVSVQLADAAPGGQQHGLAEIEEPVRIVAARQKRRPHRDVLVGQRDAGGRADDCVAGPGEHQPRARAFGVSSSVLRLIGEISLIQIRPRAEDLRAEFGKARQVAAQFGAGDGLDPDVVSRRGGWHGVDACLSCQVPAVAA